MQVSIPTHKRYLLKDCDNWTYYSVATKYSNAKKYGFRAAVAVVTGSGIKDITVEVIKDSVKMCGRQKIGSFIVGTCTYIASPALALVTNFTKIVKTAKTAHACVAYIAEILEDTSNFVWLPLDLAIFGQPVPMSKDGKFNLMVDSLDFLE